MNCADVRRELSALYDGEVSGERRAALEAHLAECAACAAEHAAYARLSALVAVGEVTVPSQALWEVVQAELDRMPAASGTTTASAMSSSWRTTAERLLWLAALLTIVFVAGWGIVSRPGAHDDRLAMAEFQRVMDRYVELLPNDPIAAERELLQRYPSRSLNVGDASPSIVEIPYRPVIANDLPPGYQIETVHVVKMPCCACVQATCRRPDGSAFALFEHDDDQSANWFGDRPCSMKETCGKSCCVVQLDRGLAVTWPLGHRYVTAVGLKDTRELEQLVAWFSKRSRLIE